MGIPLRGQEAWRGFPYAPIFASAVALVEQQQQRQQHRRSPAGHVAESSPSAPLRTVMLWRKVTLSAEAAEQAPAPTQLLTRRELLRSSSAIAGGGLLLLRLLGPAAPAALLAAPRTAMAAPAAGGPVVPSPAVTKALDQALARAINKGKAAVALRLAFHDAGTFSAASGDGGLNASIQYELDRPENFGLKRGWRIVREDLRGTPAEGVVTDADIVAAAGAFAVRLCGGPSVPLLLGRPVAPPGAADPPGRMPGEGFTAEQLKANFADKGFSVQEMVALSGAHTLGSKGFGDPTTFDNAYYSALLARPWTNASDPMASMVGLPSDHVLPDDPDCLPHIRRYADDQAAFFADFAAAYAKMTRLGVPGWA
ncbi:hypothetical protein GPECTOR_212g425 [Gonium pectorale]|uniref:L-ascorbate peroxidase n=1 Tax=Gonium pectorale TaxID=33097 RepID=A0A150FY02_GONPE|nr:hypothetical protein GPECTOR_212g425 [Gonium pectorale]|eukprot:KXZ42065.1 hypothetical protein GPECTOR_212g425 [Gonium pectorale]